MADEIIYDESSVPTAAEIQKAIDQAQKEIDAAERERQAEAERISAEIEAANAAAAEEIRQKFQDVQPSAEPAPLRNEHDEGIDEPAPAEQETEPPDYTPAPMPPIVTYPAGPSE